MIAASSLGNPGSANAKRVSQPEAIKYVFDKFLQRRIGLISRLLRRDPHSLDAIALTMTWLSALAKYCYPVLNEESSAEAFCRLLSDFGLNFEERICIPRLLRSTKPIRELWGFRRKLSQRYRLEGYYVVREIDLDPNLSDFKAFLRKAGYKRRPRAMKPATFAQLEASVRKSRYSYILYDDYRCSVLHEARIAHGREPFRLYIPGTQMYYENQGDESPTRPEEYTWLFASPEYLFKTLKHVRKKLRAWSLKFKRNIFEES